MEVSEGTFRGMVTDADPQDNSEIGTLKHDAWKYWGHSGAPLLREADGTLIGLHSSWDDHTAMRHGVPLIAIKQFLQQKITAAIGPSTLTGLVVREPSPSKESISTDARKSEELPPHTVNERRSSARNSVILVDDFIIVIDDDESETFDN